jgi:hypothetical protein
VPGSLIAAVLSAERDFRWLDEKAGWFWLRRTKKNRLLDRLRMILAIAPHIRIDALAAAVRRGLGAPNLTLPNEILLAICRQIAKCRVKDDVVIAAPVSKPRWFLPPTVRMMFEILDQHGPVLPRARFEKLCRRRGIDRRMFNKCLLDSPIFLRIGDGDDWGLVGESSGSMARLRAGWKRTLPRLRVNRKCGHCGIAGHNQAHCPTLREPPAQRVLARASDQSILSEASKQISPPETVNMNAYQMRGYRAAKAVLRRICALCDEVGHSANRCPKRARSPKPTTTRPDTPRHPAPSRRPLQIVGLTINWTQEGDAHVLPGIGMLTGGPPWEARTFEPPPRSLGIWTTIEAGKMAVESDARRRGLVR